MTINIARVLSPMYHLEFTEVPGTGDKVTMDKRSFRRYKKAIKLYKETQLAIKDLLDKSRK